MAIARSAATQRAILSGVPDGDRREAAYAASLVRGESDFTMAQLQSALTATLAALQESTVKQQAALEDMRREMRAQTLAICAGLNLRDDPEAFRREAEKE